MIEIIFEPHKIAAHGHAADDAGCAAVSAILYALAGALENLSYPGQVGLRQIAEARDDIHIV